MAALPHTLISLIARCIPTYQAAELLLFFAAHPDGRFRVEEIVVAMRPVVITVPAVREYVTLFQSHRLLTEQGGGYAYGPASAELEHEIGELARAYNERPVSLIAAIYGVADGKIQAFADSFKLRKREP